MADRVGQRFGDYRLTRFLGEGTFGDVYLGEHVYNNAQVAVKVFKTKLTPDKLKDFVNEVRTILLKHPNIVQLLDFGIGENDVAYLVMEYAPNGTLLQRHPRGTRLPLATIITYVKQIAAALQYAHDQRRIHRDVKPENILFGAHNEILLSDFGIAVVAHNPASQRTEDVIGTARYMAPEQWQRRPLPATDQYALGIIVYEWLCGENPFGGNVLQLMYQHIHDSPLPLREKVPTISPEVEQVVLTALAKDPGRRFASVRAFANALEQASRPVAPRPPVPTPIPPSPVVTPVANPKPHTTPIPAPSVLESAAPAASPPASPNKDTIQFEPPPGTAVPSTSQVADGQSPPPRPVNTPSTSPGSMITPQPVVQAAQQKRSRPLYPALVTALQSVAQFSRQKPGRLFSSTLALIVLLLVALLGGGGYYLSGTQSVQHIQALISQAQSNVRSNPTQALQQLASAQNMLQALSGDPLLTTQRSQLSQELTTTVQQAIGSYNQHAAITPLSCPAVPINDGSTGTHTQRLASVQASTGPVLYALGQDRQLYQLNSQDSLTAPLAFGNPIVDIASDETRLAVLLKATPGNDYVLGLALPGQSHLGQVAAINPSGLVNGEVPTLLAAQGADIYVVLASPAASSSTTQHTQVFDFSVDASNNLKFNPPQPPFSLPAKMVSVTAFPGHLLFFLLADGSVESVQLPSKGPAPQATPVLLPAPLAAPLALSETPFTATTPVPVPTTATALTATGPVPLQVSPSGALAADVVAGMPQLYLADMAQHRVLDLVNAATGGGVAGTSSVTLQVVQQYVSPTLVGPMTSLTVNTKGVLHVLTQNTSNPSTMSLVSINATNGQTPASCA